MTTSIATVPTRRARRYLERLCKHFGNKAPVEFTADTGLIKLAFGACHLEANASALTLKATSECVDLSRLERVIGDHLARLAFRENPAIDRHRAA